MTTTIGVLDLGAKILTISNPSMSHNKPIKADTSRSRRRVGLSLNYTVPPGQPASVARRNARERNRVKQVNQGFAALREHLPSPQNKKLSKVDTLKNAVDYIKSLQRLVEEHDAAMSPYSDSCGSSTDLKMKDDRDGHPILSTHELENYSPGAYTTDGHVLTPVCYSARDLKIKREDSSEEDRCQSISPSELENYSPGAYNDRHVLSPSDASSPTHSYLSDSADVNSLEQALSPDDEELLDVISWWQGS